MPKYVALLRATNVGGHTVKIDRLRFLFESLGLLNVETFISSGNVIFDSKSRNTKALQKKIESYLLETLGYEVATFIRSTSELVDVARYKPFVVGEFVTAVPGLFHHAGNRPTAVGRIQFGECPHSRRRAVVPSPTMSIET